MDLIPVAVGQAELGPVLWSADDTLGVQPQRPLLKGWSVIKRLIWAQNELFSHNDLTSIYLYTHLNFRKGQWLECIRVESDYGTKFTPTEICPISELYRAYGLSGKGQICQI